LPVAGGRTGALYSRCFPLIAEVSIAAHTDKHSGEDDAT